MLRAHPKRKCINPQIVRFSAMRLCIAQAAPNRSTQLIVKSCKPSWPRAQASCQCRPKFIALYKRPAYQLAVLAHPCCPGSGFLPQAVCVPHDYLMSPCTCGFMQRALVFGCRTAALCAFGAFVNMKPFHIIPKYEACQSCSKLIILSTGVAAQPSTITY